MRITTVGHGCARRALAAIALVSLLAIAQAAQAQPSAGDAKPAAEKAEAAKPDAAKVDAPKDNAQPDVPAAGAQHEKRVGHLVRVSSPITDKTFDRLVRVVETSLQASKQRGEWPVFILEIRPGQSDFNPCDRLARYLSSRALNGATTVAYVPETLAGHAVLVAMSCDEIIMNEAASIGNAGESEETIEDSRRTAYVEIANRRKTIPADVALAMLDPAIELDVVETDMSREYVRADRLARLREKRAFQSSKVVKPAGKPGVFTAPTAREMGFVSYLANDRDSLVKALGLPRESLEQDPSSEGDWRPVRIDVKGPITSQLVQQIEALIQDQTSKNDVNFICLWIESAGGSPADSMNLANYLITLDPARQRTVAYIPNEARADAAYIALACDQIVMHPGAVIGGTGDANMNPQDVQVTVGPLRGIAKSKFRSPALAAAFVDPSISVYRYSRQQDGLGDYFTEDEVKDLPDAAKWRQGAEVKAKGGTLRLNGNQAEELGVARGTVRSFAELKALYGLENDPALVEPGWVDTLVKALSNPVFSWFLLFLGGVALYAELQAPGMGVGALVATICFLLYFWAAYLGGTAGWLEMLLFLTGIVFLLLEVFVIPGFGIFGIAGGGLVLASLVLASQTFIVPHNEYQAAHLRNTLLSLAGAGLGVVVAIALMRRYLPHTPMLNRMLLAPPSAEEASDISRRESLAQFDHLLGRQGVTTTPLFPSGKARFGEEVVDVLADGDFVDRGRKVSVVEVRGNRVLVREEASEQA